MSSEIVIVTYKPHEGKSQALKDLVAGHTTRLQELELATQRPPIVCEAEDGSVLEVFEWASPEASKKAHEHPAVAEIWEAMGKVCEFSSFSKLVENTKSFPHFKPLN